VKLCRLLASAGCDSLRFDYHGVGDSEGTIDEFRQDRPFRDDVEACISWFHDREIHRFILIGECFGARTALACNDLPGIDAMVLLATHVRDAEKDVAGRTRALVRHRTLAGYAGRALRPAVLRQLLTRAGRRKYLDVATGVLRAAPARKGATPEDIDPSWVSRAFLADLEATVERGIRLLFVNGTEDPGFENFERARSGRLGDLIKLTDRRIDLRLFDGRVGAWTDARLQRAVLPYIANWVAKYARADVPAEF
jgi:hypothetical protein